MRFFQEYFHNSLEVKTQLFNDEEFLHKLHEVAALCSKTLLGGGKLLFAGNGGSAADAQHLAAEFVSRFYFDRAPLAALALTTDTSILTAIGNDYGYDHVFERQVNALGNRGDILFAISTSGNSPNIVRAIHAAKEKGIVVVGMTGGAESGLSRGADFLLKAPTLSTPIIQECHISMGHALCAWVESDLFKSKV